LYEFGRFRFDPSNHLLLNEGTAVPLTPKAFDVLLVLVQNGSRLTTKEELIRKVWPDSFVEEANLTVNVSALRKLLGETADRQSYIETVPKKGYRFVAPVREVQEEEPNQAASSIALAEQSIPFSVTPADERSLSIPVQPQTLSRQESWARLGIVTLGLVLLLAAGAAYVASRGRPVRKHFSGHPHRLAVLPFQNLRADAESEFLGFSLADAVITKLGYVSQLSVRPSYTVQKYKIQGLDIKRVASELHVDTLLTGTFLHEGGDLRIGCHLIDVKTENMLWKGVFDLKYERLLTLQDSVARQIIRGLEVSLSPSEFARLKEDQSVSPLAYEYYLRGVDLYSTGDFPMAIKMLEKSAELAPDYALTWANLGKSYTASASFQFGGAEQYQRAQKAFERALALQSDQIDARIYMANMFTDTGRVEKAVPLLRAALGTNPNHAEIHWELGYAYRFAGMLRESVSESEIARRLDPGVKLNSSALNGYMYLGQYDRFLESLPNTDDSALIVFYRGFAEYYRMNWKEAAKHFSRAVELDHLLLQAQIGKALGLGIQHHDSEGLAILRALERKINQREVGDAEARYKIAQAYAMLGDKGSALRVLKQSIDNVFFAYPYFLTDPLLNGIRSKPEFGLLMNTARRRHQAFASSFLPLHRSRADTQS
jgi:DNA-binding winged helix-turn-helix (wHTH) protein/TolB-like protein